MPPPNALAARAPVSPAPWNWTAHKWLVFIPPVTTDLPHISCSWVPLRSHAPKPITEHNRCDLRQQTPKTPRKPLPLVWSTRAQPLGVVCFRVRGFPLPDCSVTEKPSQRSRFIGTLRALVGVGDSKPPKNHPRPPPRGVPAGSNLRSGLPFPDAVASLLKIVAEGVQPNNPAVSLEPRELPLGKLPDGDSELPA